MRAASGRVKAVAAVLILPLLMAEQGWTWGGDGHRMINRLAGASLPAEVPGFLRDGAALNVLEYLGPEPDRWRSPAEPELSAAGAPDHFMDMEWASAVGELPKKRYDFERALAAAKKEHPDLQLTVEKVGLQPYATTEMWERLKNAMREYRTLDAAHKPTKPVEEAIVVYAGLLGHFVADGAQPLHTTFQYNGWTGPNPNAYTTEHKIHSEFESAFVTANIKVGDLQPRVKAAEPKVLGDVWTEYLGFLGRANAEVEQTYKLEKAGGFNGAGTPEAKQFTEECMAAGAIELRDMIYTAWVRSADPVPEYKPPVVAPASGGSSSPAASPSASPAPAAAPAVPSTPPAAPSGPVPPTAPAAVPPSGE